MHVSQGFEAPMQLGEVQSVLIDLAAGGGAVARRCARVLAVQALPAASSAGLSCRPLTLPRRTARPPQAHRPLLGAPD